MRDPRRELFAQKCAKSTQKPICEGADPFADLEDYTDELSICKSPSRHAKEVADRRLKSECSLHPTDDIQQEVGDVLVQGEDGACMKQLTQADPEMLSQEWGNQYWRSASRDFCIPHTPQIKSSRQEPATSAE